MWAHQYPHAPGQQHQHRPAAGAGGPQRYQGNKMHHHNNNSASNNGQYHQQHPQGAFIYPPHIQQQQQQQQQQHYQQQQHGPHIHQYHPQQQQQYQQQHYQQQQLHPHQYGMYPVQPFHQHQQQQQQPYASPYALTPISPSQTPHPALQHLPESVSHMSIGPALDPAAASNNSGADTATPLNGSSSAGAAEIGPLPLPPPPPPGMQLVPAAQPLSPIPANQIAGPSSLPMGPVPGPAGVAAPPPAAGGGAVSYGLVPMSPGMMSPMSVEMGVPGAAGGGPPMGVMGMGHPSLPMHPHPGYAPQMMGVPGRGGVGGMMGGYHPGPGGQFGPGPGPAHGPGLGPAQHMYPTGSHSGPGMGAPVASATSGLGPTGQGGSTPALPLSARFPPLPARPEIPATTTTIPDENDESEQQQQQQQDQTTAQLRAALEVYRARDDAWALRMDAIGFEPARAYVAAVLDAQPSSSASTSPSKEGEGGGGIIVSSTPTVAHAADSGDRGDEEAQLRLAVGKRGFAPVLGLRLLQRVHKLEKENAELYGLLEDRLQFAGAGHKEGEQQKEEGEGGGEGLRMMEDRAKATVELLENELQDAHALIAALSTALEAAERKGGNVA